MTTPFESFNKSSHFTVTADADCSVLSRVIEHFVVLDVLPDHVRSRRYDDGLLEISLKVRGLDDDRVGLVANKLRQIVTVHTVGVEIYAVGGDIHDYRETLLSRAG